MAAIDGDELEILFVETVPGEDLVRVRDGDALEFAVVEIRSGAAWDRAPAIEPVAVHRQDTAEGSARRRGLGCRGRLPESRAAHSRRARLEKTSSVKHIHKWEGWRGAGARKNGAAARRAAPPVCAGPPGPALSFEEPRLSTTATGRRGRRPHRVRRDPSG